MKHIPSMWERLRPMLQGHISSPGVGDFKKGGRGAGGGGGGGDGNDEADDDNDDG